MIFTYTKEFLVPQGLYFDIRSFCNVLEMVTFFINVILEPHCDEEVVLNIFVWSQ